MFRDFKSKVIFRTILLGVSMLVFTFTIQHPNTIPVGLFLFVLIGMQLINLFHLVDQTNRKLTHFLESIKYSDFVSTFTADNKLGESFKNLNSAFTEVMDAFRKARSEKEESWQYLNTVVQQIRTGILSFDNTGAIQLINTTAKRYIGTTKAIKNVGELNTINPTLYQAIHTTKTGKSELYKSNNEMQLMLQCTSLRIRGVDITLITLQNIQGELQKQEAEAWQNLTRVLRHEIMNSITPISSLTSTLREILEHDLTKNGAHYQLSKETADDLKEGIGTIESRSKGLIKFIDAYREYTSLPKPIFAPIRLKYLIEKVASFMKPVFKNQSIDFQYQCPSEYLTLHVDEEMIEQVIINLLKNAAEALHETPNAKVQLIGHHHDNGIKIDIVDNGPGIIQEALENIFVPFYTTKRTGSGIGLSLSRQIMQLHKGTITVTSHPYEKTVFTLRF